MLRNVVHLGLIAQLSALGLMVGVGFGLTTRFFNVFFQEGRQASDAEVGTILALGAIAGGAAVLAAPELAQRWGKARSILITQACSTPFLLAMAVAASLPTVTAFFILRAALYGLSMPLRSQLAMDLIDTRERGTAAGFVHTAFDLGGGAGAGIAGYLIATGGFLDAFGAAAVLILVPAGLYYALFHSLEVSQREADERLQGRAPAVQRGIV